jgi:hypothetical protein
MHRVRRRGGEQQANAGAGAKGPNIIIIITLKSSSTHGRTVPFRHS